mgnify:FL=1
MGYMLEIKDIYKTFNAGTINEKRALNGVNLNLNPGEFCNDHRWKRSRKIYNTECDCRCMGNR